MIVFMYLIIIALSIISGYLAVFFLRKSAEQLAEIRKQLKENPFIKNMYYEKNRRDTVDNYVFWHITGEHHWGEVQKELKEKHPEIPSIEFRESLWRLINVGKLELTTQRTIKRVT
jgi:hypothetical protein